MVQQRKNPGLSYIFDDLRILKDVSSNWNSNEAQQQYGMEMKTHNLIPTERVWSWSSPGLMLR